jgi:hypothetical protein
VDNGALFCVVRSLPANCKQSWPADDPGTLHKLPSAIPTAFALLLPVLPPAVYTACISSGTFLQGGALPIPIDGPLMIMAGFAVANMVQHLVAVPLLHNYSMRPSLAAITFTFYACFNVVYVLATVGVIDVSFLLPGRK